MSVQLYFFFSNIVFNSSQMEIYTESVFGVVFMIRLKFDDAECDASNKIQFILNYCIGIGG